MHVDGHDPVAFRSSQNGGQGKKPNKTPLAASFRVSSMVPPQKTGCHGD